ncbi:MAG TPA: 2-phosphosulfolactate phosphatase [Cyclobacteriaceae bacterium]|nr:2-phosphosulfolactate phosphatase [Cyclobacteriaceae bacterium]
MKTVEVSFSPALYGDKLTTGEFIVVIADIFRASTSICAALDHGVKSVIPMEGIEEARLYKQKGFLVAGERDGRILEFADMGNSPSDFFKNDYRGKSIAYTTTNGTKIVHQASDAAEIVIGAFVNLSALAGWLMSRNRNVVIFCAAWKNLFNLEDAVFAGALAEKLLAGGNYQTECDSLKASSDLWKSAREDLHAYLLKSSHRNRLKHLMSDSDYQYAVTSDSVRVVPLLVNGRFENAGF